MMVSSLEGNSVIVTGADRGVGLAIAQKFAANGAKVMMTSGDENRLKLECENLAKSGADVIYYAGNLREKLTIANLISATVDAYDGIDILVNASREVQRCNPLDPDDTVFDALMTKNVITPMRLSQYVVKRTSQDENGKSRLKAIVNVGSIAAQRALPELMSYSVASAALEQLTRGMALAFAQQGIRVNGIALGSIMTEGMRKNLQLDDQLQENLTKVTPLNRIGEPEDAAEVAIFLASNAARFVTGQIVAVDGGRSLLDPLSTPTN